MSAVRTQLRPLQELIRDGRLAGIDKIGTSENRADIGTKYHTAERLRELSILLGLQPTASSEVVCMVESGSSGGAIDALVRTLDALRQCIDGLQQTFKRR